MYGYGYQFSKIASFAGVQTSRIFNNYVIRVEADGGIVENNTCAINFIRSIGGDLASSLYNDYEKRLVADIGIIENKNCLISNIRFLINTWVYTMTQA